jgi:hypothetical protein
MAMSTRLVISCVLWNKNAFLYFNWKIPGLMFVLVCQMSVEQKAFELSKRSNTVRMLLYDLQDTSTLISDPQLPLRASDFFSW